MDLAHIDFIKELIEIAENDIKSSDILYENELYPQSIYLLQQSVEKLSKAYSVLFGDIEPSDIRKKIGHLTPKFFTNQAAKTLRSAKDMTDFLREHVGESEELGILAKRAEELKEHSKFFSDELPPSMMYYASNAAKISEKKIEDILDGFEELLVRERDKTFLQEIVERQLKDEELEEKMQEKNTEVERELTTMIRLLPLALITYPHAELSRYPNDKLSPKEYTKELGVVKTFKRINKLQSKVIQKLKEDLDFFEQNK